MPASGTGTLEDDDLELLRLIGSGRTLEAVGREFGMSERTVRRRLRRLCDQLQVDTPIEAVVWAVRHGYV